MTKKEIKQNLIKEDFILTSNLKDKVLNRVGINKEEPKGSFRWAYSSLVLAFSLILVFSLFLIRTPEDYSTIFIDINPSINLKINKKEIVKEVIPLNEDGIIFTRDLELIDVHLDDAIDILVLEAVNNGYFTDDFANISVSTFNKSDEKASKINQKIQNRLKQNVSNININNFEEEAKEYDISPGKMAAINKAMEADSDLTFEEALKMSEDKLLKKINDKAKRNKENYEEKFLNNNKDEKRIIHLVNQMTSIINNINSRPGKQREAYYKFKGLYDEYLELKDSLSEEFLDGELLSDFENLLDLQDGLLEIINNLDDEESNKPGKEEDGKGKNSENEGGHGESSDTDGGKGQGNNSGDSEGKGKNKDEEDQTGNGNSQNQEGKKNRK